MKASEFDTKCAPEGLSGDVDGSKAPTRCCRSRSRWMAHHRQARRRSHVTPIFLPFHAAELNPAENV